MKKKEEQEEKGIVAAAATKAASKAVTRREKKKNAPLLLSLTFFTLSFLARFQRAVRTINAFEYFFVTHTRSSQLESYKFFMKSRNIDWRFLSLTIGK